MNSYPPELLVQLAPVMFVAGLDPPATNMPTEPRKRPQDPFLTLSQRLREILSPQRTVVVWQPEKSKSFRVFFVDKAVQFPPQKIQPQNDTTSTPHSPLSPLVPSSPLHPDGLIAPIWVRKHTTLVPAVFVLFLRLYETPSDQTRTPLDLPDSEKEKERERLERRKDTELSGEIADRKKSTNERGIKLTVVLLASRKMLDNPTLDSRLTFIRRQGGLDSRAALFVLSPISPTELGEFVVSLQQALFDPALEYYTTHSKRVRRKRNRHAQSAPTYAASSGSIASATGIPRPLRPEGWTIRYEYKMAAFAEFRGEDEVALKHYQDAYVALSTMFGSASILMPRTKRWAEAKVLVDCISMKICKLYLYNSEYPLALSQFNTHLRSFGELSRSWGIGEDTFEYWSWMARQYRLLAELLEQGIQSSLELPSHVPALQASNSSARLQTQPEGIGLLGLNPSTALQHPGYYYYTAAQCTERRRARFEDMVEQMNLQPDASLPPGFANEQKIDHYIIILELYTKSYEFYKKYTQPLDQTHSRLVLWIAYRIALTHHAAGKYELVVQFLERISKMYSREQWGSLLSPLLSTWYVCARQLGDVELNVKLLIEMLGHDYDVNAGDNEAEEISHMQDDLIALLKSTVPTSSDSPFVVDLTGTEPLLESAILFWNDIQETGNSVAFQLHMTSSSKTAISSLRFDSMDVYAADESLLFVVKHDLSSSGCDDLSGTNNIQYIDLGHLSLPLASSATKEVTANLRWSIGSSLVMKGTISSDVPGEVKISKAILHLREGVWKVEIPFLLGFSRARSKVPMWLTSTYPPRFIPLHRNEGSSLTFKDRKHDLEVAVSYDDPAYISEQFPIVIGVKSFDNRELDVEVDVLLQPGEDDSVNHIVFAGQESSGLIKGVSMGVLSQGVSSRKVLYLAASGSPGHRVLDISVRSRTMHSPNSTESSNESRTQQEENLRTLTITVVQPWKVMHQTVFRRKLDVLNLSDLSKFEESHWNSAMGREAVIQTIFECTGPWSLKIENIKFTAEDKGHVKSKLPSIEPMNFPIECLPGDQLSRQINVSVDDDSRTVPELPFTGLGHYELSWRRVFPPHEFGELAVTILRLPSLRPPADGLIALLRVPSKAFLHQPMVMELTIRNFHPKRTASPAISLELEATDSFVVAGKRSGRLSTLLPGSQEKLHWLIIPLECGTAVPLPKVKVTNRRNIIDSAKGLMGSNAEPETKEEEVAIVDLRLDGTDLAGSALGMGLGLESERRVIHVLPTKF